MEGYYVFNPAYRLRNDKKRIVLFNKEPHSLSFDKVSDFVGFVHPLYAILFSFFNGERALEEVKEAFSNLTGLSKEAVEKIITPLMENKEELAINYDGHHFHFPKNVLVKKENGLIHQKYNIKEFLIPKKELDFDSWRLYIPLDALIMINTKCVTDCIYCYADVRKRKDCQIPIERFKELIKEAKELGMRSIDISGGEVFLYKHWEELLEELVVNGFSPYISTKIPIELDKIQKLRDLGIKTIQLSIDTIVEEEIVKILNVKKGYLSKMLKTLEYLNENDFNILINTQMTLINENSMEKLVDYLMRFDNIKKIQVGAAGYSLYKNNYLKYRASLQKVKQVEKFINRVKANKSKEVFLNFSGYLTKEDFLNDNVEERKKKFYSRARCSGNFYAFVILPDGKVTICEELYWHPQFIIGDLMKQSIEEVWNSEKALKLYNISREMVREESPCRECDEFEKCHRYRGVCWKMVLYAYEWENWDFPDPRCPKAPIPKRNFWIE